MSNGCNKSDKTKPNDQYIRAPFSNVFVLKMQGINLDPNDSASSLNLSHDDNKGYKKIVCCIRHKTDQKF